MNAHGILTVGFGHSYTPGIWLCIWLAHYIIPLHSFANFQGNYTLFARPPSPVYSFISTPGLCRLDIGSYLALGHGVCLSRPLFACRPSTGTVQS